MNTATNTTPEILTLTPEQFVERFLPALKAQGPDTTPADYFVRNLDTGKVELHLTKPTYKAYSAEEKQLIWDAFRWSRGDACWISRGEPGDGPTCAAAAHILGLHDAGCFVTLHPASVVAEDAADDEQDEAEPVATPKPATPAKQAAPKAKRPETISPEPHYGTCIIDEAEIEHALRRGSGFEGGKIRIAAFYETDHTPDEAKRFLKEEYGIGGCSHTFLSGVGGCVDHDASGLTFWFFKSSEKIKLSWTSVHTYLRAMIKRGDYLTEQEQQKFDAIRKQYHGKMPKPTPRFGFPPVKESA